MPPSSSRGGSVTDALRGFAASIGRTLLIARMALRARRVARAGTDLARARAREALCDLLGEARGLALKAGQVAAGLSPENHFSAVAGTVKPRPLAALYPALVAGLGRDPAEVFASIGATGRAASLGQVHPARLRSAFGGGTVAVKIRYPGIRRAVEAELRLAGLMPSAGPVRAWGFDLDAYKRFLRQELEGELDSRGEAERQEAFSRSVRVRGLVVPQVLPDLCGDGVLVQSWEDGEPLQAAASWSRTDRLGVARILIETFLTSLFSTGRLHGDPNPGNVAVRRRDPHRNAGPQVVLYDYGCVLDVARTRRLALLRLVVALREGLALDCLACLAAAGFDPGKLAALGDAVEPLCRLLLEPLIVDRPFEPSSWCLGERLDALLGDLKWWFRSAGPPDLLLLIRALHGLARQLRVLDAPLPWWPLLRRAVGEEGLATARALRLPALDPSIETMGRREAGNGAGPSTARLLKVRVDEDGREVRSLALPASEALYLDALVPSPVRSRLRAEGVDLRSLGERLHRDGLPPGEVLRGVDGSRRFEVWLE